MFAGVHLKYEEKDFVYVPDWNPNGLAQFSMFIEAVPECDVVRRWCPWLHERFLDLGLLARKHLEPCGLYLCKNGADGAV